MTPEKHATVLSSYAREKSELLACIDELLAMGSVRDCPCEDLREKVRTDVFHLVVVGQFKRGKTSLINALLGAPVLPVAAVPLTSIVTVVTYGDVLRTTVRFLDGREAEIGPEALGDYVTEKGNPKNGKAVAEVIVAYPSPYLRDGVRLIDTPGVGSIYQHNTDAAYQYLPKADAVLFLLSVDQPMSRAELDFLHDVKAYANKIFFLLNKTDYLSESELRESLEFSRSAIRENLGADATLFPVSARLALDGLTGGIDERLQQSMLPQFAEALNRFLLEEKGTVLLRSAARNLQRAVSQARFEKELESRSLDSPLAELEGKIAVFEEKKREVLADKQDFDIMLDGETRKLAREVLDGDITLFRKELLAQEQTGLEEDFGRLRSRPLRELRSALEQAIVDRVRQAYHAWRFLEDDRLAKAFEAICRRYASRINKTVDGLMRFSSGLFDIPFETIRTEMLWSDTSRFSYKFRDEPVGLQIVASSLTLALPKLFGDRIILKKMQEYLVRVVDMQAGRLGADFEERLDRSKLDFRREMLGKIDAAVDGITAAIAKGMSARSRGEQHVAARKEELAQQAALLDRMTGRLGVLLERTGGDYA